MSTAATYPYLDSGHRRRLEASLGPAPASTIDGGSLPIDGALRPLNPDRVFQVACDGPADFGGSMASFAATLPGDLSGAGFSLPFGQRQSSVPQYTANLVL